MRLMRSSQLGTNLLQSPIEPLAARMYEWKDKVVIITGAATGIGAGVVRILMREEVKHVAILDVDEEAGINLQNELNGKYGNKVKFYKCDVTKDDQLLGSIDAVVEEQGTLDVLVNNAGIMNDSYETYKKQIDVNVTALVTATLKAIEVMGRNKGGKGGAVINVASVAAISRSYLIPIYFSTKSAVLQFSNCIGMQEYYSKTGVRVIVVCIGATDTSLLSDEKLGSFDKEIAGQQYKLKTDYPLQKMESAAQGLVDAYKYGESGSTWLANANKPVKDITQAIKKGYSVMSEPIFE